MSDIFYCYSDKLSHFIRAFSIKYVEIGFNSKNGKKFYAFEKSERLDKIIQLYKQVQHTV